MVTYEVNESKKLWFIYVNVILLLLGIKKCQFKIYKKYWIYNSIKTFFEIIYWNLIYIKHFLGAIKFKFYDIIESLNWNF